MLLHLRLQLLRLLLRVAVAAILGHLWGKQEFTLYSNIFTRATAATHLLLHLLRHLLLHLLRHTIGSHAVSIRCGLGVSAVRGHAHASHRIACHGVGQVGANLVSWHAEHDLVDQLRRQRETLSTACHDDLRKESKR